jgi:spoIIIJ-associated protein
VDTATGAATAPSGRPSRGAPAAPPEVEDEGTAAALRGEVDDELSLAAEAAEDQDPAVAAARTADVAGVAAEVLREILARMDMAATVEVRSTGQPITLDVSGESLGLLIGRHGDTLSSLQYILNVMVGRRTRHWSKIVVDVEGYRARREDSLRLLAERQADRVRRSQREVTLDYMPARERRIVHVTLQGSPDVSTHSVGDEPYRRVVITPKQS